MSTEFLGIPESAKQAFKDLWEKQLRDNDIVSAENDSFLREDIKYSELLDALAALATSIHINDGVNKPSMPTATMLAVLGVTLTNMARREQLPR